MINNQTPFQILGITENATEEDLKAAYQRAREPYLNQRFDVGESGRKACEMLDIIETSYQEADDIIKAKFYKEKFDNPFQGVEDAIKTGDINKAQIMLDNIGSRNGEWHYYQSIVFFKKTWYNDAKKHLQTAISMEPYNTKYTDSLKELEEFVAPKNSTMGAQNAQNGNQNAQSMYNEEARGNGSMYRGANAGRSCSACDCCNALICTDCCCECMGGDCISCC